MADFSVPNSLTEEPFWPEMSKRIRYSWRNDLESIKKFCKEREIRWLYHFTAATNLKSIFHHGIMSRNLLAENEITYHRIDGSKKLYFEHFNYLSISSPNTKMLYRKFAIEKVWVALVVLDIKLLWKLPFFSIPMNSAKRQMRELINQEYERFLGMNGLRSLFANSAIRYKCKVPKSEPTDVQSELIFLDTIPSSFFRHILLTPVEKTSKDFLSVGNNFGFFESGSKFKYEWKWLAWDEIKTWDPKFSSTAQENYNLRNWNEDWLKNG